ncbi:hypothetical protein GZH53_13715 [Flavihumibacter sp. R14]|nr:hypothetical protein [Flavihumibacter soli]
MVFFINNPDISNFDWATWVSSVGAILVGLGAIYFSYLQFKNTLRAKKDEEKRGDIYKKLDEFYGPLLQLRNKSNLLYEKFTSFYTPNNPNFSTLLYLLDGNDVIGNEKVLLDEIIKIGEQCERLIHEKSGLIDDDTLRNSIFPQVTTHFLILRLAYNKALVGEATKYRDLTFPKNLDQTLKERITDLERQLK